MILVTGNAGYIGSHLTNILYKEYSIFGMDKNYPKVYPLKFLKVDITKDNFGVGIIDFDCVIHLAGEISVSDSLKKPALYYETNVIGTLNVLKTIKTKSFIFASTGCVEYMNNPYAISKKAAEDVVIEYCKEHNIPFTIFRFYNVIGKTCCNPTNPDGLFTNLIKAKNSGFFNLYGNDYNTKDGSAIRDYLHVNEVCYSIKKAITDPSNSIENLGHGIGLTVKEMIKIFKEVNDCEFDVVIKPRRDGDLEKTVLSNPSKYMTTIYDIKDYLKVV